MLEDRNTQKVKRYFHRIATGQKIAQLHKRRIRFITLTTSDIGKKNDLSRDFDVLLKRIRRKDKTFQYWKIITDEGNGVIHLLYTGKYLTHSWLVYNWNSIHKSYIVDIRNCDNNKLIANYLVNQYLSNQNCNYTRMSYSKKWMFPNAIKIWKNLIKSVKSRYYYNPIQNKYYLHKIEISFKTILKQILLIWDDILYKTTYSQKTINDYG